ncbi:MAG: FecR domain-containing protein [Bacteroides sp.]|uniref:FecR family protein n=1 Tax=Bacteroides sp. TaxID=29523 RepID=UPI002FC5ABA1|nr:FecR family protein [Bacteroides sp.]
MNELNDDIIKKYLQGECSEEDFIRINTWIKESKDNARKLFLMEETYQAGKRNPFIEKRQTEQAEARLFKRLEIEKTAQQKTKRIRNLMKYAAIIAVVLLGGSGVGYWIYQLNPSQDMLMARADNAVQMVTLPDGTKVWLNQSTTLTYPRQFSNKERNVHLEGEAYFEVTKNRQKPFIVESQSMRVRVLGTIFNFKSSKDCRITEASLIEGEIEVKGQKDEGMVILLPGQKAELNKTTGRLMVKQVNARMDAAWHDGLIPFEQADIFEIAQTLERFYDVKIILSPDIKADKTYSGVLKKKDTIDAVLKSLTNSIPINYKIVGDNIFISSLN